MLTLIIIALILIGAIGTPLVVMSMLGLSQAKRQARQILNDGYVDDPAKAHRILGMLNHTENDLQAADLWQRLNKLVQKSR